MSRRIIYKIEDRPEYLVTDEEWDEIKRLQHWYNSEFTWTTGKLSFRRYLMFPNAEEFAGLDMSVWKIIEDRKVKLRGMGMTESEIVAQLELDHLVFVKWGGYYDDCLASGFTRVADNEWNAFLVCDFLLKVSTLIPHVLIDILDEGRFVRTKRLFLRDGVAMLQKKPSELAPQLGELVKRKQFFSIVDPGKFDKHPSFKNSIPNFNDLDDEDKRALLKNWNWLGFGNKYENSDDTGGVDLNQKLRGFDFF
ncbi:MAG TPA: hypothetical protein VGA55_02070 [Bacteroidota bacterium]